MDLLLDSEKDENQKKRRRGQRNSKRERNIATYSEPICRVRRNATMKV
jgi:hypothetical protein